MLSGCGGSAKASPSPTAQGGVYRQHVDGARGFIIDYPDAWNVYEPTDPAVAFIAGPNTGTTLTTATDFVEVRVISGLSVGFSNTDTQAMKQVVDTLLANQPINVVSSQQVNVNGLPGWQETYTFQDTKTNSIGAHVHVFLFQGTRLHTIVFQALPRAHFDKLAPTFQKILNSYRALPLPSPSPGTSPAATPGATAAPTPTPTP